MAQLGSSRTRPGLIALLFFPVLFLTLAVTANAGNGGPDFSKLFEPDTIGPGSTSTLTFTIDNSSGTESFDGLNFTDMLPTELDIATPAAVVNDCSGTVDAPDGTGTITFTDGELGAGETCTISVNITGDSPGEGPYTNESSELFQLEVSVADPAEADLTVDDSLPGFTKEFDPSACSITVAMGCEVNADCPLGETCVARVEFGGRSTLEFEIDNSSNGSAASSLIFEDTLPAGMVIADPSNAATDCDFFSFPTLTAVPGTDLINLVGGGVGSEDSCTVTVDVVGGAVGFLGNVSDELFSGSSPGVSSGRASAVLEVTGFTDLLELSKEFVDDPVPPGGTVTIEFTVTNKSRDDSATGITFTDDLEATLSGLTPTLPPEGFCTFSVGLDVPATSTLGVYPNTTGAVSGLVGGSPDTGNSASDLLFVVSFPILTKEFTDDPVGAGGTVTLEFTITNPDTTSKMSDIEFIDELTDSTTSSGQPTGGFLPFPVSVTIPPGDPCGTGSSLTLVFIDDDREALELLGGSLATNDSMPGGA